MKRLFSIFTKSSTGNADPLIDGRPPRTPENTRLYAVGDIHGRADLLDLLLARIEDDAGTLSAGHRKVLILLGDYIDRGPASREVIERLLALPPAGFDLHCLKGNHEDMLLRFLDDPVYGFTWRDYGGKQTLDSYGVRITASAFREDPGAVAEALNAAMPPDHLHFLRTLELNASYGDYFFVHAGVRPGTALDAQSEKDQIWIRDQFLNSTAELGKIIVHGHTPQEQVQIRRNRIGIDTGAFATDVLTCLVLDQEDWRLLQTGA